MFDKLAAWFKQPKQEVIDEASLLLKSQAFQIAAEAVENRILTELVSTTLTDTTRRELLYLQYKAVQDVLQELAALASTSLDQPGTESNQGEI